MQTDNGSVFRGNISDDGVNYSTTAPIEGNDQPLASPGFVLRIIFGTLALIITFFGNLLVLYVFATDRKLRTYSHYYIVGLAVADFISGGITPSLENVSWFLNNWPFGEALCTVSVYINHVFLHGTFLMTLTICIDRYRALTMPLKHLQEKTLKHALFMICITYSVPVVIWTPLIIILPYSGVTVRVLPPRCYGSYGNHFPLLVFAIAVLSWLPMIATTVLYIFVFRAVIRGRQFHRYKYENKDSSECSVNSEAGRSSRLVRQLPSEDARGSQKRGKGSSIAETSLDELGRRSVPTVSSEIVGGIENRGYQSNGFEADTNFPDELQSTQIEINRSRQDEDDLNITNLPRVENDTASLEDGPAKKRGTSVSAQIGSDSRERRGTLSGQERSTFKTPRLSVISSRTRRRLASLRATRTLTCILVVMLASGLPWSVAAFWAVIDSSSAPTVPHFMTMSWLVHLSSAVNPFCYAVCNPLFKKAFLRVLCCGLRRHRRH